MSRAGTSCRDCRTETLSPEPGVPAEYYMVHDHVWKTARAPARGYLCVGCLEARLGRQLHRGDFTGAQINDLSYHRPDKAWWWRSDRLRGRLTAPSPADGIQLALWDTTEGEQ
jgi:hypothetical protein